MDQNEKKEWNSACLNSEITKRSKDEQADLENELLFRAMLENSQDVLYCLDIQTGRFKFISPSIEKISGYSLQEAMAGDLRSTMSIIHPDDLPALQAMQSYVNENGKGKIEYRQLTKNGEYRVLSNNMFIIKDSIGQPIYRCGNIRDITDAKLDEEALISHTAELCIANRNLETFAYSASHDLKNTVFSILTWTEALLKTNNTEDKSINEELNCIKSSAERMELVLTDLLELTKVTHSEVHIAQCNLSEMAQSIAEELKLQDPFRKIKHVIEPGMIVNADKGLIWNLLENLLSNAWKFSAKISDARVEFGKTDNDKGSVYFIRDNGVGFDMDKADKLFEPFQRLHTQEDYPGTGLGLTIAKRIVENLGGTLTAEAEKDRGATFYFSLGKA